MDWVSYDVLLSAVWRLFAFLLCLFTLPSLLSLLAPLLLSSLLRMCLLWLLSLIHKFSVRSRESSSTVVGFATSLGPPLESCLGLRCCIQKLLSATSCKCTRYRNSYHFLLRASVALKLPLEAFSHSNDYLNPFLVGVRDRSILSIW